MLSCTHGMRAETLWEVLGNMVRCGRPSPRPSFCMLNWWCYKMAGVSS